MCIICVSPAGANQPSKTTIRTMFRQNPHGAGYMYARNGKVHIHKGYMEIDEFLQAIESEHFTAEDSVVYHFRISTQAGITPEMTHPFPLSNQPELMKELDIDSKWGVAHNGVIRMTSDPNNREFSDTAVFITDYLSAILRRKDDTKRQDVLDLIFRLAKSKFAIMNADGEVATVGSFVEWNGNLYSNTSYRPQGRFW